MNKNTHPSTEPISMQSYQRFVERLRARINVLNASVFLLEDKISAVDPHTTGYFEKVNEQLELLRILLMEESDQQTKPNRDSDGSM